MCNAPLHSKKDLFAERRSELRAIDGVLDKAVYGGFVCAVISDGSPTKLELTDGDTFFEENTRNKQVLDLRIKNRKTVITERLMDTSLTAQGGECDLLAAIREAKTVLTASWLKDIKNREIIIIGSGVSTSRDLNLLAIDDFEIKPDTKEYIMN